MKVLRHLISPNYDPGPINVEFLVLHYTAGRLERTLSLFTDEMQKVSAHLIIAEDGEVFELVRCLDGTASRAWHAGASSWVDKDRRWENFNDFSLGIELVNLNGNLLPYTSQQYAALVEVVRYLRKIYPALNSPDRVLGHEQIAGFRGKADPGCKFDWKNFFESCYPNQEVPSRQCICPSTLVTNGATTFTS